MSKKINQLDALTDNQANDSTKLFALADPTTGTAYKVTLSQARDIFATKKYKYVATGSEGTTITISELAGMEILLVVRESGPLFEVDSSPSSSEFTWDNADIVLGTATNTNERFLIHYRKV